MAVTIQKVTALAITLIVVIGQVEEIPIPHHNIPEIPIDPEVQEAQRVQVNPMFVTDVNRRLLRRYQIQDLTASLFKSQKLIS